MRFALFMWAGFLVAALFASPWLASNFDEGVYLAQGALVWGGSAPYRDFFHHQTPLYILLIAPASMFGSTSLFVARGFSILATATAGLLLGRIASAKLGSRVGLLAQGAFYLAPLTHYGLLVLPNGCMILLTVTGFYLLLNHNQGWGAGTLLAFAVFVKPLAISTAMALVVTAAAMHRRRLLEVVASGALSGALLIAAVQWWSQGGFLTLLELQLGRYGERSGFEVMENIPEFARAMDARGVFGPIGWSLAEHLNSLLAWGPFNGNAWLLVATALAPFFSIPSGLRVAFGTWLGLPMVFALFVWEPVWDHYFLQYVPVFALGAAITVERGLARAPRLTLSLLFFAGAASLVLHPLEGGYLPSLRAAAQAYRGEAIASFNPMVHAVAGTRPACGLIDPMNVFGEYCAASLARDNSLARFRIDETDYRFCLGSETPVLIDRFAFWFASRDLLRWLAKNPSRLIFATPSDRVRFDTLSAPPADRVERPRLGGD